MSEKDLSLDGKVVLVAGASRGIGEATAKRLARNGAMVVVSSRKIADCDRVAEEIRKEGGKARAMTLHLGSGIAPRRWNRSSRKRAGSTYWSITARLRPISALPPIRRKTPGTRRSTSI